MKKKQKQGVCLLLSAVLAVTLTACAGSGTEALPETETQEDTVSETAGNTQTAGSPGEEKLLRDKDTLYENDDDTSVITMYLTVSTGNVSENTNHTWQEINSYSVYDYDAMGVDRYAVNGLLQVGDENGPSEGAFGYGQNVPNATVTIRGQTSSRNSQKNYKIELKDDKGKWNDQRVINLNKHQGDPGRFTNKLCYDLIEELPGMIAMQTQFVHLFVKDETEGGNGIFQDYGLYTQVEQPNKSYLKRHGLDNNGQFYKINFFEFFRYEDIIMLKSDADYDETAFEELIEIKGDDDHSKLIAMLEDVNNYSIPIEEVMDKWFERDNFYCWMAFHILMGNVDTQSRNTMIYSPLNSNTWYFISWDCDGAFQNSKMIIEGEEHLASGWEHGISNYWGNVLFQRILKSDELRAQLDDKIQEYRSIITEEKLTTMVSAYREVTKPYAYRSPDNLHEPLNESQFDALCNLMPTEVERNYQVYLETLTEPMPFFIGKPEYSQEGLLFGWDNSYDFSEENIYYTFELSDNLDFTDPIIYEDDIFVPEIVYEGELEHGQYFIRVKATNESGKEQYAFDYYVSDGTMKNYGIKCFYILPDGTIEEDVYEE